MAHDDSVHRCIHAACARPLPRRVNFCPFCGTGQHAAVAHPAHAAGLVRLGDDAGPGLAAGAGLRGARGGGGPGSPVPGADAARPAPVGNQGPGQPTAPVPGPAGVAPASAWSGAAAASALVGSGESAPASAPPHGARQVHAASAAVPKPAQGGAVPRTGTSATAVPPPAVRAPARPPPRPVRLRTLLLVFGLLWLVWHLVRPDPFADRVERAVTLASVCGTADARRELAALEHDGATAAQLDRIRGALASAQPACQSVPAGRSRGARARARPRASGAAAGAASGAASGTSAASGAPTTHPPAGQAAAQGPAPASEATGTSAAGRSAAGAGAPGGAASRLVDEARAQIGLGNYRVAAARMEVCLAMTDGADGECARVRALARRLQGQMTHCLSGGGDWVGAHCE